MHFFATEVINCTRYYSRNQAHTVFDSSVALAEWLGGEAWEVKDLK